MQVPRGHDSTGISSGSIRQVNRMGTCSCTDQSMRMEEPDQNPDYLADDIPDTLFLRDPGRGSPIRSYAISMFLSFILNLSLELGEEIIVMKRDTSSTPAGDLFHPEPRGTDRRRSDGEDDTTRVLSELAHQYSGLNREDFHAIHGWMQKIFPIRQKSGHIAIY